MPKHFLIIEARFYPEIADELVKGASEELKRRDATFERMAVPGVLEIPLALAMAAEVEDRQHRFDGFVLLGCVIRGETSHYDIVAKESARTIMDIAVEGMLAIGNGILTVENEEQAWARARTGEKNKGAVAATAAFTMAALAETLGLDEDEDDE